MVKRNRKTGKKRGVKRNTKRRSQRGGWTFPWSKKTAASDTDYSNLITIYRGFPGLGELSDKSIIPLIKEDMSSVSLPHSIQDLNKYKTDLQRTLNTQRQNRNQHMQNVSEGRGPLGLYAEGVDPGPSSLLQRPQNPLYNGIQGSVILPSRY